MWVIYLLATYGIVFMLQNKWEIRFFCHSDFFENLLDCAFCLGFWLGGLVWITVPIFSNLIIDTDTILGFFFFGLLWSFASATFCYVVDKFMED